MDARSPPVPLPSAEMWAKSVAETGRGGSGENPCHHNPRRGRCDGGIAVQPTPSRSRRSVPSGHGRSPLMVGRNAAAVLLAGTVAGFLLGYAGQIPLSAWFLLLTCSCCRGALAAGRDQLSACFTALEKAWDACFQLIGSLPVAYSALAFVLVIALSTISLVISTTPLNWAVGGLFGVALGAAVMLLGCLIGSIVNFVRAVARLALSLRSVPAHPSRRPRP